LQDWYYITYGDKKPFEYFVESGNYQLTIPYPNNLKMPGDIIVAQMVDPEKPSVNKMPVIKGPSKKLDFDSHTVFKDSVRNTLMAKIFGFAGVLKGYLVVIPPLVVDESKSKAHLYLPGFEQAKIPQIDDILKIITNLKLFPSLDQYQIQKNLDECIKTSNAFVLIAQGRAMEMAFADYVIPNISLEKSVGKLKDDGTIDYKERGSIKEVFEGDIVGQFVKGSEGKEGFTVYGQRMAVIKSVKGPAPGKNLYVDSENQNVVRSLINGFLEIKNNILDVNETLIIPSDIDYNTGNIEFSGNIEIRGKISDGFSVTSFGNITVHGIVEAAHLFSKNNMNLMSGVLSKEGYKIQCMGNMYAKFIQSSDVFVKKDLIVDDFIYHSRVRCNGTIQVTQKTGVILGGVTTALKKIEANIAGNKSGLATELICGVDQELDDKIMVRKRELMRLEEAKRLLHEKVKQSFSASFLRNPLNFISALPEDKKKSALQVLEKMNTMNEWIRKASAALEKLEKSGDQYNFTPEIIILQKKYDGVKERVVSFGKNTST